MVICTYLHLKFVSGGGHACSLGNVDFSMTIGLVHEIQLTDAFNIITLNHSTKAAYRWSRSKHNISIFYRSHQCFRTYRDVFLLLPDVLQAGTEKFHLVEKAHNTTAARSVYATDNSFHGSAVYSVQLPQSAFSYRTHSECFHDVLVL